MLKELVISNISNGYSMYFDYKQKNLCIVIVFTLVWPNTYLCYSCIGLKCTLFLMSHYFDINCTCQMFAHNSCVFLFYVFIL